MKILNYKVQLLAACAKFVAAFFVTTMNVAVTDFMIKISKADFYVIHFILSCRRRKKRFKFAE